jgi:SAM-dependent methyltransferase
MLIATLQKHIDAIDQIGNAEWMKSLTERKRKELDFHNRDRDATRVADLKAGDTYEKFYGNKKYYSAVQRSTAHVNEWIRLRCSMGGVFLDYACGNGEKARYAARAGAELSLGFDISDVSIANARRAAKDENLANVRFFQADAEDTRLPDNSVDTILCSGMLHHLDISYAFPEIRRILKPMGRLLAVEALDYNPAIKLYRLLTPAMRTDWEKAHILSLKDVAFARRFFEVGEVRYWHVIGYLSGIFPKLRNPLDFVDRGLERIWYVQRLAWMFTFELIKRLE